MAEWRDSDTLSVSLQRRFKVLFATPGGAVSVIVTASTLESVIDQVKGHRIATPPKMDGFTVEEIENT